MMELILLPNLTLEQTIPEPNGDFFANVYGQSPLFKWGLIVWYLLGVVNCCFLAFVANFERSGEAGQYRTVVNQLASQNIGQVRAQTRYSGFCTRNDFS